ncbi:hypothetical protein Cgig2_033442 [Carnegiea gigantea]|uniref:Uncharacterized protein n=1 Tax=Carnegiea gigantea TaxID=171969 RepID=A0A9Q1KVC8_9CARY|nr:hypothetical protein Cgig2_033442 [Carnegiea gigantea]
MRIRKNSKLIHGGNTSVSSSSSPSSFLICQLNRSPWDVLDVFSLQGEWDASFESIPPSDSVRSGESMELSFEYVEKPPIPATATNERENGSIVESEAIKTPPISRHIDHHISASPHPPLPPKKAATTTPKRRGRPKKPATPAATATANNNNPYEFYYYSGFGPSWAKRRGGDRPFDDDSNSKNKKTKKKKEKEKEDDNGVDMVDEELDYIDDYDDDDDEEEDLYGGSKRARKPIKARSLKSLM